MSAPGTTRIPRPGHRPNAADLAAARRVQRIACRPRPATRSASWSRRIIRGTARSSSGSSTATRIPTAPGSSRSRCRRRWTASGRGSTTTSEAAPRRRSRSGTLEADGRVHVHGVRHDRPCPGRGEQVLLSRGDPFDAGGLAVGLDETGALELVVGGRGAGETADTPHRWSTGAPMRRWEWYFVAVGDRAERRSSSGSRACGAGRTTRERDVARRVGHRTVAARGSAAACGGAGGRRASSYHFDGGRSAAGLAGRCRARRCCASRPSRTTSSVRVRRAGRVGLLGRHRHRSDHGSVRARPPRSRS